MKQSRRVNHTLTVKKGIRTATIHADEKVTVETGNRHGHHLARKRRTDHQHGQSRNASQHWWRYDEIPVGNKRNGCDAGGIKGTLGIKLTCGASSIEMNPAMIKITAPMVMINS